MPVWIKAGQQSGNLVKRGSGKKMEEKSKPQVQNRHPGHPAAKHCAEEVSLDNAFALIDGHARIENVRYF